MASYNRKRKREVQSDMDDGDLSFTVEGCSFLAPATSKRRRQTIHGSQIRNSSKPKFSTSTIQRGKRKNEEKEVQDNLRGTLRRRLSSKLYQHKMKKLQDYSLPLKEMDNFSILRSMSSNCKTKEAVPKTKTKPTFTMPSLPENEVSKPKKKVKVKSTETQRFYTVVESDYR
ncbi:hypothetical protein LOTGIDRAFT_167084 [Lottia gigantea]|uniref:Tantalus-like domain-containing protein n=1 Tax=Lottia gigantea TaxID=225164 RepID=V3Z6W8_LOTGI|nr:hypothetical protein LOTGIDRAFT_167084 [Lottia gigantea]ESO86563.1 hypothetical protein LOTGIDRAFT_167084 [Lottia gigantea]